MNRPLNVLRTRRFTMTKRTFSSGPGRDRFTGAELGAKPVVAPNFRRLTAPETVPAFTSLAAMKFGAGLSKLIWGNEGRPTTGQRARALKVLSEVSQEHPVSVAAVAAIPVDFFRTFAGEVQAGQIGDHYDEIRPKLALPPTDDNLWDLAVGETEFWNSARGSLSGQMVSPEKRYGILLAARSKWEATLGEGDRQEWDRIKSGGPPEAPPEPPPVLMIAAGTRPLSLPAPNPPLLALPVPEPVKRATSFHEAVRNLIRQAPSWHAMVTSDQRTASMFEHDHRPMGGLSAYAYAKKWFTGFDRSTGALVPNWAKLPPGGAVPGSQQNEAVPVGTKIDRWGSEWGRFLAADRAMFTVRALPVQSLGEPYHRYEVIKEIPAHMSVKSIAAEGFEERGGGVQYELSRSVQWLAANGYIKEIT